MVVSRLLYSHLRINSAKGVVMKIYQIYVPELATYIKYKVLDPENIDSLIDDLDTKSPKDFKLAVLEHVVYNVKSDITDSLRLMSREAAERCVDAMYNGCVMLNPRIGYRSLDRACLC
jgi:hypothetical protein